MNKQDEALNLIGLHVLDIVLFNIEQCTIPKEKLDKLTYVFENANDFHTL